MRVVGVLALLLIPGVASASPTVTAAVTGGSLGVGPEFGVRGTHIGVRGDATFLNFAVTVHSDDTQYDGRAKLRSAGGMIDVYPFGGGLHVSVGGRYNRNRGTVKATPTRNTLIGGSSFTPTQIGTLSGSGRVKKYAPALSLGYGSKPGRGFLWGLDAGAFFQGRVQVSALTSSTGMIPQTRLDAEQANLQADVGKYKVFPLLQAKIGWRF
jgi:hypothetical protein